MTTPAIFGFEGPTLSADERAFFKEADPAGYILFARNIETRPQLRALTDQLRALSGANVPILIDQEGGRVARMRPPEWPAFPAGNAFGALYDLAPASAMEAARCNARALGLMLRESGINVDCLPMLDVRQPDADEIVGDRAYGADPLKVASIGRAVLDGLAGAGCIGVMKHIPGHGRATVDSHKSLPIVEADEEALAIDLHPFAQLADQSPMAMVAHVVFTAWDKAHPASQSSIIIEKIIRGRVGYDGLLMSDDSGMGALCGSPGERALACIEAGCDLALPCNGVLADNMDVADALPSLSDKSAERLAKAMAGAGIDDGEMSFDEAIAKRDALLALCPEAR